MPVFVMRVWIPDRPGALGVVASRIGEVGGDLVGIEILERGAGRAIDELMVELPDESLVPRLVAGLREVADVDVETVHRASLALRDARLDALLLAAALVERRSPGELLATLVRELKAALEADWVTVVEEAAETVTFSDSLESAPSVGWLMAFVRGMGSAQDVAREPSGPDDVAFGRLGSSGVAVIIGREGRPFRARERRQLTAIARIAGCRLTELRNRATALG